VKLTCRIVGSGGGGKAGEAVHHAVYQSEGRHPSHPGAGEAGGLISLGTGACVAYGGRGPSTDSVPTEKNKGANSARRSRNAGTLGKVVFASVYLGEKGVDDHACNFGKTRGEKAFGATSCYLLVRRKDFGRVSLLMRAVTGAAELGR